MLKTYSTATGAARKAGGAPIVCLSTPQGDKVFIPLLALSGKVTVFLADNPTDVFPRYDVAGSTLVSEIAGL